MGNPILTKQGLGNFKAILDYQVAQMAKHDPVKVKSESIASLRCFIDNFLPHHFLTPFCALHIELMETLNDEESNKRIVRIAPRGHGKTTLCSFAFPLWCLATKRKRSVLVIGSNQELANQNVIDLVNELESNTYLLSMFPHLAPKKDRKNQYVKYTDSHVVFDDASNIVAKGVGGAIRGIRPRRDLIIIDDPEKDSDLVPATRQKNKDYFNKVVRFLGGPGQSLDILAIDTLKHYDSLIQYIMEKPGWDAKKYSAVIDDAKKQVLWPEVYCYDVSCLKPYELKNWKKRGLKGFTEIREPFHGRYFNEAGELKIIGVADQEPESFAQEFLSQPIELSSMPLRAELWRTFPFSDDLPDKLPYKIGSLDLSMGKKRGDYQAIGILGATVDNYYLLDASLTRVDLVESEKNEASLAGLCIAFIERYGLKLFVVEDNGAQGLFINSLNRMLKAKKINCKIRGYRSTHDKIERITTGLGLIMQRGSFHIREDWQQVYPDFMRQFEHFPKGDHDDAPDVTNMALIGIQRMRG